MKLKLMYVVPHLSTGGMPQFVLKRIESLQKFKNEIEIYLVEYSQFSTIYLVQRNKIIELLGNNHFFSLGSFTEKERKIELIDIIKKIILILFILKKYLKVLKVLIEFL